MNIISTVRFWLTVFLLIWSNQVFAAQKKIENLKPTVILISLDGFRADYFEKYQPKNLSNLAKNGVRAKWLIPSYPSLTFPNHYTIATGLYPQNHGIVGNSMFDLEFQATFSLSKREEVQNGRWWQGEPIWATVEKQGQRAAAFFFPGTEAEIAGVRPTFWKSYDEKIAYSARVDQILEWIDLPVEQRPTFYTLYFDEPDHAGHEFSPDAKEVAEAIKKVDKQIGRLIKGLKKRKIFEKINLVIVSDHGMTAVKPSNFVIMDDYFDAAKAERIVWGSQVLHIFPKAAEEDAILKSLVLKKLEHANCYRKADFPRRFYYQNNSRIAPIVCMAEEGWKMTSREFYEKDKRENKLPTRDTGAHGYDNNLESMRAIFVAHGAAFKQNTIIEPFENIHVYNIMTRVLDLTPAKNDGNFEAAEKVLR